MHRKSMVFGIGIGILVMVAVSFVTYIVQRAAHLNENANLVAMVHEQENNISFLEALAAENQGTIVDAYYVIDRARDIGMVFPAEIEPQVIVYTPESVEDEDVEEVYNSYDDIDEPDEPDLQEPDDDDQAEQQEIVDTNQPDTHVAVAQPDENMHPPFIISSGVTASEVSSFFEQGSIVESGDDFLQFLINNGYATSILAGSHAVPRGASFEEIVNIIVYGN
ncbi:MAG: hypothetical protein FWE34_00395 [Defluviitaleaceae bacterium]|nr:hypothetical protein [Defluviitaleaceae bacterium]